MGEQDDHNKAGHGHAHGDHDHGARISTPAERELLLPFTDDVHGFLRGALQGVEGKIVEVGAGDGVVADRLRQDGFDVVAIDAHEGTASAATEEGRPVLHADWRSWDGGGHGPFAAVLFTRSLHHIDPIEHAMDQLTRLAPGGLLIADEFGHELVDAAAAQMLMDWQTVAAAAGLADREAVAIADPSFAWQHRMEVEHEVTPSTRMLDAIRTVADIEQMGNGRFIAPMVTYTFDPEHPNAAAVRDLLIATEEARIAAGIIPAAGLRLIARIRP